MFLEQTVLDNMEKILFILKKKKELNLFSIMLQSADDDFYTEIDVGEVLKAVCCNNKKCFPQRLKNFLNIFKQKKIILDYEFIAELDVCKIWINKDTEQWRSKHNGNTRNNE